MTIKYTSGRQEVISAELEILFSDITASGVAENAIQVPHNARLVGGDVTVLTAFNSTGTGATDTLKVGDANDDDRYTSSAVDLRTLGRTALTLTGYEHSVEEFLKTLVTSTPGSGGAVPTAGKFRLSIQYVVKGRVAFAQGLDFRAAGVPGA